MYDASFNATHSVAILFLLLGLQVKEMILK
jgi:hypothetical protein